MRKIDEKETQNKTKIKTKKNKGRKEKRGTEGWD